MLATHSFRQHATATARLGLGYGLCVLLASCGGSTVTTGPNLAPPTTVADPVPVPDPLPPVIVPAAATGKINDSGMSGIACYAAGTSTLVDCASAGAIALNPAQDGAVGRDAEAPANSNTDGKLGFSFTKINILGEELPASATSWSCVKDNITGLIWEVKTTGGPQDYLAQYTNLDGTTPNQLGAPVSPATTNDPTTAQIQEPTNSVGYVAQVKAQNLCGSSNWRLPSASELQGIVDYSIAGTGLTSPALDPVWFGSTGTSSGYWSGTQLPWQRPGFARNVVFSSGTTGSADRILKMHIRLVRSN